MIVVLIDQIFHLLTTVFMCRRIITLAADVRDLCPYDKSILITYIIEILTVLIVCKTDRICSNFPDQIRIKAVIFFCQCISLIQLILMSGNSTQFHRFSI